MRLRRSAKAIAQLGIPALLMEAVGGDDEGLRLGHDKGLSVDPRELSAWRV